ncbi:hypothetical protein N181_02825 [Sinorhizobium fredii USDA 205]|uniref:Uncharacterized protein n=1 Tax=Rhizobium fredii TaxID=380 RepID=A0A844A6Q7_RHIFR|nr:hypothetical protein [Sinorhizobium fredii]KSV86098.1 hypothetical protein N181_02825 [Sinorhizobium fredii USDA 205]MQX07818.1 hypothetical protein [Sinorhizobium fredii]GEC33322.1 hypothetical protein EFR01_34930 [Sinorhizobium fredii]GLS07624.1 hypothetical protein GCM10007864_12510 [Sinorhizobium fredii]
MSTPLAFVVPDAVGAEIIAARLTAARHDSNLRNGTILSNLSQFVTQIVGIPTLTSPARSAFFEAEAMARAFLMGI